MVSILVENIWQHCALNTVFLVLLRSARVKADRRTLMKLTPGVDFINVQRTAFTLVDPKSAKIQLSRQYLFMLSRPTSVKSVRRTLMKLTPGLV
jgi:hypothetical protein